MFFLVLVLKKIIKIALTYLFPLTVSGRLATAEHRQVMVGTDDCLCVCLQEVSAGSDQ
jgi:hypothetical protein